MYIHIGKGPSDASGIWSIHESDHPIPNLVDREWHGLRSEFNE